MSATQTISEKAPAAPAKNPRIAAFCCYHSAYEAADVAGTMHLRIPEGVNIIRVPCTGRVDVIHMVRAVEKGYDGVLALGCHEENCKFLRGNLLAHNRADMAQKLVREAGFDTKLIQFHGVAANQPHRFANILWTMHNRLAKGSD